MRLLMICGLLCLVLAACGGKEKTVCSRYVKGFVKAAHSCDIITMDKYSVWIARDKVIDTCSRSDLQQFERAAKSCGFGG